MYLHYMLYMIDSQASGRMLQHPNPVEKVHQSYLAGANLGEDRAFRLV
jgi:hypothetical protein